MRARVSALLLALVSPAWAQSPPALSPESLRPLLDDPNGNLSRAAKGLVGPQGGNRFFYFQIGRAHV